MIKKGVFVTKVAGKKAVFFAADNFEKTLLK